MTAHAERTSGGWRDGETRDLARNMSRLTLGIVGKTLFDSDVESEADEIGAALTAAIRLFGRTFSLPFFQIVDRLPLPSNRRFAKARSRIDATIGRLIAERRRAPGGRSDLLTLLVQASDTEGDGTGMTDAQVRDQAATILPAGHETTANALTCTWYLLRGTPRRRPDCRPRPTRSTGLPGSPTFRGSPTRRWSSPSRCASFLRPGSSAGGDGRLRGRGYTVRASRSSCVASGSRTGTRASSRTPSASIRALPPGSGGCPPKFSSSPSAAAAGMHRRGASWMEGVLLLATLARRWRLRLEPGHPAVPAPLHAAPRARGCGCGSSRVVRPFRDRCWRLRPLDFAGLGTLLAHARALRLRAHRESLGSACASLGKRSDMSLAAGHAWAPTRSPRRSRGRDGEGTGQRTRVWTARLR